MRLLKLTPVAMARVWLGGASVPAFEPDDCLTMQVGADPGATVAIPRLTVEAIVPRGARAEYGLLGVLLEHRDNCSLQVEVPYSQGVGTPWAESLAKAVDDVRLGIPAEYARPILEATTEFAVQRFPPGFLRIVEGAHGVVGSSPDFFRRLTHCVLELMNDGGHRDDEHLATFLRDRLVG